MAFSPTEAAFEGFKLTRERPGMILGLFLLQLVGNLATQVLLAGFFGPQWAAVLDYVAHPAPDPAHAAVAVQAMGAVAAVALPLAFLTLALGSSAVFRAVLRPGERGLASFSLGFDELRVGIVWLTLWVLWFLGVIGVGVVVTLVLAPFAAISPAVTALAPVLMFLGVGLGSIAFWVRFSLAPAAAFAERRIRVFETLSLTRGRFWPLFRALALAMAMFLVVTALGDIILAAIETVIAGPKALEQMSKPDFSSLAAFMTPLQVVSLVVNSLIEALSGVIIIGALAVAWRNYARIDIRV